MKERKKLNIQNRTEEKVIVVRHRKKTGNPIMDRILEMLIYGKQVITYCAVAVIVCICVYVLFDFSMQEKIVAVVENIFF